jgi:mannose-1-phosphate guanylyltransferase
MVFTGSMNKFDHYYAVIMAGGGGVRLWPLSRQKTPKQVLKFIGERSLFQLAVDRLSGLFDLEKIYVVTNEQQAPMLMEQAEIIPADHFLIEPQPKNTAPVVALAAAVIGKMDPDATLTMLTADHFINNKNLFQELLVSGYHLAQQGRLVTIGIRPTFPASGYGYIQRGDEIGQVGNISAFKVKRFTEKPDRMTAEKMVSAGDFDWNSGMFIWRCETILEEINQYMPDLGKTMASILPSWGKTSQTKELASDWSRIIPQSVDFGVMEKTKKAVVIPAHSLGWNDVGSWQALFDILPSDEKGNIILRTQHKGMDTENSLVYSENQERLVVTVGVKNMVIVDTHDVLFICPKDDTQNLRQVVTYLKENGLEIYL